MNELLLPDVAGSFQRGYAIGNQIKKDRQAEKNQNMLTGLAPRVIGGDPEALAQAAAISPAAAERFDKIGGEVIRRGAGLARYILDAYKDGNGDPAQVQQRYQHGIPFLTKIAKMHGAPAPSPTFDPSSVPLMKQFLAMADARMNGTGTQRNLAVSPGSAIVDPNTGQVIYERPYAPARGSWKPVDVPDGMGGTRQMEHNEATGEWRVPQYGGPQQPTPFIDADGRAATIGPDVSPRDRLALLQSGGLGDLGEGAEPSTIDVTFPQIDSTPAQFGGGMGYTPPKPAGGRDAPSGYQWAPDGSSLIPIPGGPADRKNNPTPADQARNEMQLRKELSDRLKQDRGVLGMYQNLERAAADPSAAGDLSMIFAYMKMLDPGSVVREQEFANAQNAAGVPDQIRNAYNRTLNGQRLNTTQRADFLRQAASIAANAQQRISAATREYQGIADQYGYDPRRATGMADFRNVQGGPMGIGSQPQAAGGPQAGTVQDGYRFRGGDPANPANWERL